jgi:ankyrin repeat protein
LFAHNQVLDLGRMEMAPAPGEAPGNGALVPLPPGAALACAHRGAQLLTPAHNAAYNNALEMLRFLVARGAPLEGVTSTGKTPLMLAAGEAHGEAVAVLVEAGVAIDTAQQGGGRGSDVSRGELWRR